MARLIKVLCKRDTTDSAYAYFYAGREYTVPADHPCMMHFEPLEDVAASDFEEEKREKERKRAELAAARDQEQPRSREKAGARSK
jgi:hypothetical protein